MNNRKAIMIGGGILVLGIVGFIVMKKLKKRKQDKDNANLPNPNVSQSGMGSGSGSGMGSGTPASYNSFNDRKILYEAMKGIGTDESAMERVASRLTNAQKNQLLKDWENNIGMYDGETLCEWIEGDFTFGAEDRMLANFNCPN